MVKKSENIVSSMLDYLHNNIKAMNDSKIFAGLMIITLNIASKFVTIKLSKTMESYLKYTFSRDILVFAITWMGTRDIYIALLITVLFVIFTEYLFHEESEYFMLSEEFKDYHITLLENEENNGNITEEDVKKAKAVLEKAKELKMIDNDQGFIPAKI